MPKSDWFQLFLYFLLLVGLTPLLGTYMAGVFEGRVSFLNGVERGLFRLSGIDPDEDMSWMRYARACLLFNLYGFAFLLLILLLQGILPLNPQGFPGVPFALAFNTAASFVTNTNWQAYAGESTLSYFSQMVGLTVQNFLSAATGMAALIAFIRGIASTMRDGVGNFWQDIVRMLLYILLPLCILLALFLVSEGVIQNFSSYVEVTTLEGAKQSIPMGPVASQIAIKQLGTNGGGFFNANSAHPFENPTPLTNFFETLAIILLPAASIYMFGTMLKNRRHAWLLFGVMFVFLIIGLLIAFFSEVGQNPVIPASPHMEGKEVRFGMPGSLLWSVTTTDTANGSINAMLSSLSPIAGGIPLFNIMLGELIFGGVGVGLASMLMFVLLTVFLSGLMVGRTPEYMGKKIEKTQVQWIMVSILTPGALILIGAGISCALPAALTSLGNTGPHGLTEILYAFTSSAGNNGSAFAGLNANTDYFNYSLGMVMILCRLAIIVPSIAVGGLLAKKKISPPSVGTFSTETGLFAALLFSVIMIVGALTFFPALSLGPIIEQLLMYRGVAI